MMLKYFQNLFIYEEVLEQKNAGEWRKVRRYKNSRGLLLFFGGLFLFFVALTASLWIFLEEEIISFPTPTPPAATQPEIVVSADIVSPDIVPHEPIMLDESDNAFSADVTKFASRAIPPNGQRNEVWGSIKKGEETLSVYEKMEEGNKEIGEWKIFTNGTSLPVGTFSALMVHDASDWTHDFGNGIEKGAYGTWFIRIGTTDGIALGIHGTLDDTTERRVSIGIQMKNSDLAEFERLVFPKMRVMIDE